MMTLRELYNAITGYNASRELIYRAGWEQTRFLSSTAMNSTGVSKKRYKPVDMLKFPWDEDEVDRTSDIELIKERRKWLTEQ